MSDENPGGSGAERIAAEVPWLFRWAGHTVVPTALELLDMSALGGGLMSALSRRFVEASKQRGERAWLGLRSRTALDAKFQEGLERGVLPALDAAVKKRFARLPGAEYSPNMSSEQRASYVAREYAQAAQREFLAADVARISLNFLEAMHEHYSKSERTFPGMDLLEMAIEQQVAATTELRTSALRAQNVHEMSAHAHVHHELSAQDGAARLEFNWDSYRDTERRLAAHEDIALPGEDPGATAVRIAKERWSQQAASHAQSADQALAARDAYLQAHDPEELRQLASDRHDMTRGLLGELAKGRTHVSSWEATSAYKEELDTRSEALMGSPGDTSEGAVTSATTALDPRFTDVESDISYTESEIAYLDAALADTEQSQGAEPAPAAEAAPAPRQDAAAASQVPNQNIAIAGLGRVTSGPREAGHNNGPTGGGSQGVDARTQQSLQAEYSSPRPTLEP
ncbi:hypothetical protein OG216_33600 [Streptomycetaceae bacterium NBC_01309]